MEGGQLNLLRLGWWFLEILFKNMRVRTVAPEIEGNGLRKLIGGGKAGSCKARTGGGRYLHASSRK